jgi:hypothetical protein
MNAGDEGSFVETPRNQLCQIPAAGASSRPATPE